MNRLFSGKSILALLLFSALAACASWQEGWTDEYKTQFKEACLSGEGRLHPNPDRYCDCVLEKTTKRYPTIASFMEKKDTVQYRADLQTCGQ